MANPEHLAILKQGVEQWNTWREKHAYASPRLEGADLRGWNLSGANLSEAHLFRAELGRAILDSPGGKTITTGANLCSANLRGANLAEADLRDSNLAKANLGGARLDGANVSRANLAGTDFTESFAGYTVFANVDFSTAKGLETVEHLLPSTVGIDTIYKSKGKIPEVFLRGCGVPEEFIAYIGSMVGRPIEYYSCFISYSTKDQAFADRLYADLQAKGVRCWFAPHDIMGGRKIHEQIDEAIRVHDKLLLILSEDSMASEWVGTETGKALKREKSENKRVLFPVRLVEFETLKKWEKVVSSGVDVAEEIRQYYIPDFSGWERDHAGYQREFEKLVAALKASNR